MRAADVMGEARLEQEGSIASGLVRWDGWGGWGRGGEWTTEAQKEERANRALAA